MVRIEQVDVSALTGVMPFLHADQMGIDPGVGTWLAALDDNDEMIGLARITEVAGARTIDDVWVRPESRNRGIASALLDQAETPVWLICDEDMIGFYERRGFVLAERDELPAPLAALYIGRREWPADDHAHYAMVRPTAPTRS